MRRVHLERAMRDAGYESCGSFGRAIGRTGSVVARWVRCELTPSRDAALAIASALELSPGADCDSVLESDLAWLLEPCETVSD